MRRQFLEYLTILSVLIWFSTEFFSQFHQLHSKTIQVFWLIIFICFVTWKKERLQMFSKKIYSVVRQTVMPKSILEKTLMFFIGVIVSLTALTAFIAPPNNWDSMSYHLPRVMHWAQQHSVNYYPTHIVRQVYLHPFAEYCILHLYLLTGSDQFFNFVQWVSMVGCLMCVSVIAQQLGLPRIGQLQAAAIAAAIPMGVLQASSTQNDYLAALFISLFVLFGLVYRQKKSLRLLFLLGSSLGLGCLTKGTVPLFVLPFCIWFFLEEVKKEGLVAALRAAAPIVLLALVFQTGFLLRNLRATGHLLYTFEQPHINGYFSPGVILLGILKHAAMQFWSPSVWLNSAVEQFVVHTHAFFQISVHDPLLNWNNTTFQLASLRPNEDFASNPIHLILILCCCIWLLHKKYKKKMVRPFFFCLISAFCLMSAVIIWSPWNTRYVLALFILSAPVIASCFSASLPKSASTFLEIVLLTFALRYAVFNDTKPFLHNRNTDSIFTETREAQLFNAQVFESKALHQNYQQLIFQLQQQQVSRIGIICGEMSLEYPLWAMMKNSTPNLEIHHIGVQNLTGKLADNFEPQVVVYLGGNEKVLNLYTHTHQTEVLTLK